MATVYRAQGRPNWMIAWFDSTRKRRVRSAGTTDKRAAQLIADRLETDATLEREGLRDTREDVVRAATRVPLAEFIQRYVAFVRERGASPKHVQDREAQLVRLTKTMRVDRVGGLTPARVQSALAEIRRARGNSLCTLGRYVRAIKGLTRWLVREGQLVSDPLVGLSASSSATDRRRERRALSTGEAARLIQAAEKGPAVCGLSGIDRAALYRLALGTGFRASELASLTPESFRLDAEPPTIHVRASQTKNRKQVAQPIRHDLADAVRRWLARKRAGTPVFAVKPLHMRTAIMMRVDLAAAGIPYIDDGKFADFHALRHTFISDLVRSGASVKQAQVLARHSTPVLTLQAYAHVATEELTRALDRLPPTAGLASAEANGEGTRAAPVAVAQ